MVERIEHDGVTLAIVVRASFSAPGVEFFTPDDYAQQVGYLSREAGTVIPPHEHPRAERTVAGTQEVLIVRHGRMRVDLYDDAHELVADTELGAGDVVLLAAGGHGFEMLDDVELLEIKTGPFQGEGDRLRFEPAGGGTDGGEGV